MKYKLAVSGYMVIEVEANNEDEAINKIYEDDKAGELYNLTIEEITPIDNAFVMHTDLNG